MKCAWLLMVAMSLAPTRVWGDSLPPPFSYATATPDGRFVFVMISSDPRGDGFLASEADAKLRAEIRSKYHGVSGMYRAGDSTAPLWSVRWYEYPTCIRVPNDGIHLIRIGPHWPAEEEVLAFYANGERLRAYQLKQLVRFPEQLTHTVTTSDWKEEEELDDQKGTFALRTAEGDYYVFDLRTGEIVGHSRTVERWLRIAVIVGGAGALVAIASWFLRRLKSGVGSRQ